MLPSNKTASGIPFFVYVFGFGGVAKLFKEIKRGVPTVFERGELLSNIVLFTLFFNVSILDVKRKFTGSIFNMMSICKMHYNRINHSCPIHHLRSFSASKISLR